MAAPSDIDRVADRQNERGCIGDKGAGKRKQHHRQPQACHQSVYHRGQDQGGRILVLNSFGGGLSTFLRYPLLPGLFCIGLNIAIFVWLFRRDLRIHYDPADLPEAKLPDRRFFYFTASTLVLIAVAYVAASAAQFPLSIVALGGGGLLLAGAYRYHCLHIVKLGQDISWPLFVFITGMFIVVRAVENLGLTAAFGRGILQLADGSLLQAVLLTAGGTALGANLINNVRMALVMISVLGSIPAGSVKQGMVHATIFGADLGPNLTTVGSLATMLWLLILRRKGLDVSTRGYFKLGVTVVPVMIVVGSLLIWLKL